MNSITLTSPARENPGFTETDSKISTRRSKRVLIRIVLALATAGSSLGVIASDTLFDFTRASQWPDSQVGVAVAVAGDNAFLLSNWDHSVVRFDVSHPDHPVSRGRLSLPNNNPREAANELSVSGDLLFVRYYVLDGDVLPQPRGGFHVFDLTARPDPLLVGSHAPNHGLSALEVSGPYAYAGVYNDSGPGPIREIGLRVLDVSNPAQPVPLGICTNTGWVNGLAVSGNRVYVAGGEGLTVVDVSDPQHPILLGSFQTAAGAYDVAVSGSHVFVATGGNRWELSAESGLEVIDVSNPAQPQRVGRYFTAGGVARITLHGSLAWIVADIDPTWRILGTPAGSNLQVVDVSEPEHPRRVDKRNLPSSPASSVAVANGCLFLPGEGICRIEETPAVSPTLRLQSGRPGDVPELWAQTPGFDDFTLMTATSLSDWQPYATVFSRLDRFRVVQDAAEPRNEEARFYRAVGAVPDLHEMQLQWKTAGLLNYRFRFERTCPSCNPKVLSGLVWVDNGIVTRVDEGQSDGVPIIFDPDSDLFPTIEQFFWTLYIEQKMAELMIIKRESDWNAPAWVYIRRNGQTTDEITYRITELVEVPPGPGPDFRPKTHQP